MTTITETKTSIAFAVIAALSLGAPLEGGTYQGILTQRDGTHVAVVLLPDLPPSRLSHPQAVAWAESVGGMLPSRPAAALLYAVAKEQFNATWYWTSETLDGDTGDKDDASLAWYCDFDYGNQNYNYTSASGAARAVRLIHIDG